MAKKKTIEELEQAAKAAETRARELRAKAREMTKAEEARTNAEIIKAVRVWRDSYPADKQIPWSDLPKYFLDKAEHIRQHYSGYEQENESQNE